MRGKHELYKSFFILCQLILLLALIHGGRPNARNNWIFFIPIFTLCIYSSFFCASARATADYPFIQVFINLIPTSSDYILLRNRQGPNELRKIGQKKDTAEMSFTERLAWASSLLSTSRGIGWAHEPTAHIPPRPTASKGKFIVSQLTWIFLRFILFDAALIHIRQNPCYRTGGPSLGAFGWQWRMTAWVFIVSIYCSMNNLYAALSVVAVATGLYEPRDWPPLFGSPLYSYTVRNCWGRVWHQMLRRTLTTNSNFVSSALHLPPRRLFTTYFKLFTSFLISGLIHATGDYVLYHNFSQGGALRFFLLQAVAITFEDAVIAIFSRLPLVGALREGGGKNYSASKLVGYIWVFAWFTYSMPIWLDPQVHAGTVDETRNLSLIRVFNARFSKS